MLDQLTQPSRKNYFEAFKQIARHEPKSIFADPILKLAKS